MQRLTSPARLTLVAVLVAACAAGQEPTQAPTSPRESEPSSPPEPTPRDPAAARWAPLGEIAVGGFGLLGVDAGYVALDEAGPSFSSDGRTWQQSGSFAMDVPNCPGWGPPGNELVPDADIAAFASNGRSAIVGGAVHDYSAAACAAGGAYRPGVWITADGRSWHRSTFGSRVRVQGVWAGGSDWGAIDDGAEVWRSDDGETWRSLGTVPGAEEGGAVATGNGRDVIAWVGAPEGRRPTLLRLSPGGTWDPVAEPGPCGEVNPGHLLPARGNVGFWLAVSGMTICSSSDLQTWRKSALPTRDPDMTVVTMAQHEGTVVVSAARFCVECPTIWRQFITANGLTWSELGDGIAVRAMASGPAGLIGIGRPDVEARDLAWRLDW